MNENEKINQEVDEPSATPSDTEVNENTNVEVAEEKKTSKNNQVENTDISYEIEDENDITKDSEKIDSNEDIIDEISDNSNITLDYLSPDLLKIKSISFDEIDTYSMQGVKVEDSSEDDIYSDTFSDIKQGEIVSGMIVGVNDRDVLVDVGFKSENNIYK